MTVLTNTILSACTCRPAIVPALLCIPLIVSDFRSRRVSSAWMAAFGAASSVTACVLFPPYAVCIRALCNTIILGCMLLATAAYLRIRYRRAALRHCIGAGDGWFLLAAMPLFPPAGFIRYLLIACLSSLLWWLLADRCRHRTIPFVGVAGTVLSAAALLRIADPWNF